MEDGYLHNIKEYIMIGVHSYAKENSSIKDIKKLTLSTTNKGGRL